MQQIVETKGDDNMNCNAKKPNHSWVDLVSEKVDLQVEGEDIRCTARSGEFDADTLKILPELKKHKRNTLFLLTSVQDSTRKEIAVDIETTALSPFHGEIRLISMFGEALQFVGEIGEREAEILADPSIRKVFHNAAFDVTWMTAKGYRIVNYTDTMIMGQILHNNAKSNNSLQALALEHLNVILDKTLQGETNWQGELTESHKQYALKDAEVTYKLYQKLRQKISEKHLDVVLSQEMGAMSAIIELNRNGVPFDYDGWSAVLQQLEEEATLLETEVRKLLDSENLNLSSPAQLIEAFEQQGIPLNSTTDETLAKYESKHSAIKPLRKYKKLQKQLSTYGEKLKKKIGEDGRIRAQWRLIGTDTSRMTSKKPNLQGLPSMAKPFVKAPEGKKLVIADYSAIELRILAELTQDAELVAAFKNGEDLHAKTARAIFNKAAQEEVTNDERKVGKVVNFGLVYGMTAYGLQKKIRSATGRSITLKEAGIFRNRYFELYPSVLKFQDQMLKADFIQTLGGRYWSEGSTALEQGAIKRFNHPIQCTGAEGLKITLDLLMKEKPSDWKLIAVIHDEAIIEIPEHAARKAAEFLVSIMKRGMRSLIPSIPIEVECNVSDHWSK